MRKFFEKMFKESKQEFCSLVEKNIDKQNKMFIITANPETFMTSEGDKAFEDILLDSDTTIIGDGIGIVKGAKILGITVKERIPGIEIVEEILKYSDINKKSIYFYGSKQEVIDKLEQMLKTNYPGIDILGLKNGYTNKEEEVFADIKKKAPDVILVAQGIPRQELIIARHYKDFEKGIFIGVGGSLDVLSGAKKRAPKVFIKLNLEWFYRLLKEPSRIKRFCKYNLKLIFVLRKIKNEKEK